MPYSGMDFLNFSNSKGNGNWFEILGVREIWAKIAVFDLGRQIQGGINYFRISYQVV